MVAIAVSGTVAAIVLAVAVVLLLFWMIRRLFLRRRSRSVIVESMKDSVTPVVE